jgi:CBS domain-containing protein
MSAMSPSSPSGADDRAGGAVGGSMYRFLECTASQYMTRALTTVSREVDMRELTTLFERHDFNSFPVVENDTVLGIVTKFDFLRAFAFTTGQMTPHYDELMRRQVRDIMTEAVVHVEPSTPLTRVLQLMVDVRSRSLPVMTPERRLVGIISREDIMRALKETTQNAA